LLLSGAMTFPALLFAGALAASPAPLTAPPPHPVASVQAADYPEDPGADQIPFLHLRRGALIECIAFSAAYLRAAPGEDCIVLPSPAGQRIGGVAVYTRRGRLFLRSVTYGVVPLPGLGAADINHLEKIVPAMAEAVAHASRLADPPAPASDEAQLQLAALAVSFFPSTLGEVRLSGPAGNPADGARTRVLVLDWNQKHYLWNPATGVIEVPVPVDPLTQTPYLCVQQPELPGSVLFAAEYARLHPAEKAEVLIDPLMTGRPLAWLARGAVIAAYTAGEEVRLHNGAESLSLPGATRGDFADVARLTAQAMTRYHRYLEERGALPRPVPAGLAGDTDELQLKRAHFRLQVANARPGRIRDHSSVLVIDCGSLQCAYAPGHGAAYSGWLPPYPALLVDGIVFAAAWQRDHPAEQAVVLAHPPPGRLTYPQGGINAHVFYTREGELWGHIAEDHVGEYRVGAGAAAIADQPRLVGLCTRNPAMQDRLARAAADLFAGAYRQAAARPPADEGRPFSVAMVAEQLRTAGVPCRIVRERERAEDGRVTEYPATAVIFNWAGESFVYARQKVFRARARGYDAEPALN
jgi:hypothetical protein